MAVLNQCSFIGRLGKEPELSVTANKGIPILKFSLAIDQEDDENPLWLNITCWGKLAENIEKILFKGAQVFVQGKLKKNKYKGKDKVQHEAVEIIATIVQLLDKQKGATEQAAT